MREKILKILFPEFVKELSEEREKVQVLNEMLIEEGSTVKSPTYRELMQSLGLEVPDLAEIAVMQKIPHFYDGMSKEERLAFLQEVEGVSSNHSFEKIMRYWLEVYAHFIACQATSQPQVYGGWLNTNVIGLIKKDLRDAHEELVGSQKPEEDYDPYAITFGQISN